MGNDADHILVVERQQHPMTDQNPAEDPTQTTGSTETTAPAASFSARPRRVTTTASDGRQILGPVDAAQVPLCLIHISEPTRPY